MKPLQPFPKIGLVSLHQLDQYPIYHARFKTKYQAGMTLCRMQEHAESPRFRNKIFTWEEYSDWYATSESKHGCFSYPVDFIGYNIPGISVRRVYYEFEEHQTREWLFLEHLSSNTDVFAQEEFYLLATSLEAEKQDGSVTGHEISHGLYYVDPAYRKAVKEVLGRYPVQSFRSAILKRGYHKAVVDDEVHAYALHGWPRFGDHMWPKMKVSREMLELKRELVRVTRQWSSTWSR